MWVFRDDEDEPFPVRSFDEESRPHGLWGGIYDGDGNPVVGCDEYMVFKDRETAEFIVKAVNFYMSWRGLAQ